MELLKIYNTLDSTNKEASRLIHSGEAVHGTVIMAYEQTHGHGQYGRKWHTQPGNHLAISIIILPARMMPEELPMLSMKTSLALVRSLAFFEPDLDPLIKWPNDVYVRNQKLAGIMIENSLNSTSVQHSIVGIGLNVNESSFPPEIPNAISLHMITGKKYDIIEIAIRSQEETMNVLNESLRKWKNEYDHFIYGKDQQNNFEIDGKMTAAKVLGVDHDGKIILEADDEKRMSYFSHEIKWVI